MQEHIVKLNQDSPAIEVSPRILTHFLEQMPEPGMIKDSFGRYVFINMPCGELLGIDPETAVGKTDQNLFSDDMSFILMLGDMDVIKSRRPFQQTHTVFIKNEIHYLKISISVVNHSVVDDKDVENNSESSSFTYVKLIVSDTGPGIPDSVKEHIFDPFYTTKDSINGTGLGLYTVKGIVSDHGGAITVKDNPKKGATFEISFPLSADHKVG